MSWGEEVEKERAKLYARRVPAPMSTGTKILLFIYGVTVCILELAACANISPG